ncbi:MAG: DUF5018 domain-containing protein [Bacteroides sp.]|uniref:DUF5018 domain-containing protein n=1 Tax=Bacteroides sp. TaxID=29523 RepID=UPI002FC7D13B
MEIINFRAMKILSKITAIAFLLGLSFTSCESPDYETGRTPEVNGLQNVILKIPGNPTEFAATKKGPYAEGEEITVKVPTADEDPLDVTRLICTVSLQHNCYVENPVAGETDFTQPLKITVIDALGNRHNNTIRVLPTPPKTRFTEVWSKSHSELGVNGSCCGVAMNDKYIALQIYFDGMYLIERKTGKLIKPVESASSCLQTATTDDGGNILVGRYNQWGAGFMVFRYVEETNSYETVLDYTADYAPGGLATQFSVIGDVTKGKAFIYASMDGDMTFYYWELKDGQLVTPINEPNKLRYGPAGSPWGYARIQRASLEDNSDLYVSYFQTDPNDADTEFEKRNKGSRFHVTTPSMEVTEMNPMAYFYKILDFKVFNVENDRYVILNQQTYSSWGGSKIGVYDITNYSNMELGPDDDGFNNFCLFSSSEIGATNYNKWGFVAVYKEVTAVGYDVYFVGTLAGSDMGESKVRLYKMSYYRQ